VENNSDDRPSAGVAYLVAMVAMVVIVVIIAALVAAGGQ